MLESLRAFDDYVPEPQKQHRAASVRKIAGAQNLPVRTTQDRHIIEGVEVAFPYTPYPCQKDFMATTLRALQVI